MDKKYLYAGFLGFLVILVLFVGWQASLQPEIALKDVSLSEFSLESVNVDLVFDVTNPYLLGGTLTNLDISMYGGAGEKRHLLADVRHDSLFLPAMEKTPVTIPVSIHPTGVGRSTLDLIVDQELPVQVTGMVQVTVLGIPMTVPVNETRIIERDGLKLDLQ